MYVFAPFVAMARPVYTAPVAELSTITSACALFTVEFQPETVPSRVSNKNAAGWPAATLKPVVPLKTVPVGVPTAAPALEGGMVTTSEITLPELVYSVERPVAASAIQNGLFADSEMPQ